MTPAFSERVMAERLPGPLSSSVCKAFVKGAKGLKMFWYTVMTVSSGAPEVNAADSVSIR